MLHESVVNLSEDLRLQKRRKLGHGNGSQVLEPGLTPFAVLEDRLQLIKAEADLWQGRPIRGGTDATTPSPRTFRLRLMNFIPECFLPME